MARCCWHDSRAQQNTSKTRTIEHPSCRQLTAATRSKAKQQNINSIKQQQTLKCSRFCGPDPATVRHCIVVSVTTTEPHCAGKTRSAKPREMFGRMNRVLVDAKHARQARYTQSDSNGRSAKRRHGTLVKRAMAKENNPTNWQNMAKPLVERC
jgi:hypothetical protein